MLPVTVSAVVKIWSMELFVIRYGLVLAIAPDSFVINGPEYYLRCTIHDLLFTIYDLQATNP